MEQKNKFIKVLMSILVGAFLFHGTCIGEELHVKEVWRPSDPIVIPNDFKKLDEISRNVERLILGEFDFSITEKKERSKLVDAKSGGDRKIRFFLSIFNI